MNTQGAWGAKSPAAAGTVPGTSTRETRATSHPTAAESAPATPIVVKLGGRALEAPGALPAFAAEAARLSVPLVFVHGGGAEVSTWLERLAIAPRFEHGLRVTDAPTLDVVAAVLAGLANKRLVAALRVAGVDAVGLSALDGGTLRLSPHPLAATLGAVGAPAGGDASLLWVLIAQGRVPVLASLGMGERGELLNVNADDGAAAIAALLGARHLILLSDTPGLLVNGALVPAADAASLAELLHHPDVTGGMAPKLAACTAALAGGVPRVTLARWQQPGDLARLVSGESLGTVFTAAPLGEQVPS